MIGIFDGIRGEKIELIIARLGLAFPFIYAAVASLIRPENWISFFPPFMVNAMPKVLIPGWALLQIIVGVWLIIGKKILIPSIIASVMLVGIFIFNFSLLDIIFRDVSILATAIVLTISSYRNENSLKI
ncbi:MAG: DoxX family membrane protein [Candidatus Vogelbacteria bacterium]|nr:DoxX family membrane protein [Candidatus Vogelbacteria bacterium]